MFYLFIAFFDFLLFYITFFVVDFHFSNLSGASSFLSKGSDFHRVRVRSLQL